MIELYTEDEPGNVTIWIILCILVSAFIIFLYMQTRNKIQTSPSPETVWNVSVQHDGHGKCFAFIKEAGNIKQQYVLNCRDTVLLK